MPFFNTTVLVGFLTLLGVLIGLWFNYWKTKQELDAAAKEAHRERVTAARKEVYLEMVGEMGQVTKLFGDLPLLDINKNLHYADRLIPFTVAVNRVWLVGEVATAIKARELLAQVNELLHNCRPHLLMLQEKKEKKKRSEATFEIARTRYSELKKEL